MPCPASWATDHSCSRHTLCSIPHSKRHDISTLRIDRDFCYTNMCRLCHFSANIYQFWSIFEGLFHKVVRHHWLGVVCTFGIDLKPVLSVTHCSKTDQVFSKLWSKTSRTFFLLRQCSWLERSWQDLRSCPQCNCPWQMHSCEHLGKVTSNGLVVWRSRLAWAYNGSLRAQLSEGSRGKARGQGVLLSGT